MNKSWMLPNEQYDKLNPPFNHIIHSDEDGRFYAELSNSDEWLYVGHIPTPKTRLGWFLYNLIHGLWMKYPLWKVLLFAMDKDNNNDGLRVVLSEDEGQEN